MLVSLKLEVLLRQRQSNFASVSKLEPYLQTKNKCLFINVNYTANVYRQTTDKLMFKSVISTVR